MPKISLRALCLVTAVLCNNVQRSLEHEIPRRSFLSRRAIDGTRGRKYFDPSEDGAFDSYGSAGGQYDPYDHVTDLSDIRKNVPGEPGVDYPAYTILPQTGFTCEGRSRGYYADEAAGCQVFHVCHDVLVSSFLCPIGSTFSQKLLTCDWWTKVDCASSNRYLGVNRNSYQIDDDEMIRNAYAMISLQSSAEDVTKDGLVDPDSGARIIDYSALTAAKTMTSYTPGFRRITDYAVVYATGNDLPSGFDYSRQDNRQVFTYDRYNQQKEVNSNVYRGEFRMEEKGRSPYHASPIIRHDYQRENDDFQNDYRRPDGFTDQFQVSYAPTVPTVTTTTRRFYSPTVPTTYRPSTLAYSKLDLMMDSSDHLYAHSKSSVTPSTTIRHDDDTGNAELRERQTKYGGEQQDPSKSDSTSTPRMDGKNDDIVASADDQVRGSLGEKSDASFRINVTDAIDEDEVFRQQNERPLPESDYRDSLEDIETRDSIGIAHALSDPAGGIIARNQNPVDQPSKSEQRSPTTPIPLGTQPSHSSDSADSSHRVLDKSDTFNGTSNDRSPTTEDYVASTTKSPEETTYTRSLDDRPTTTPSRNWQQKDDSVVRSSTTISRPTISTTESSVDETRFSFDQNRTSAESVDSDDSDSAFRINLNFEIPQPAQFLQPPLESFLINVPEEARYTTSDESFKSTSSAEIARLSTTPPTYNENTEQESDYNENVPETPSLEIQGTDRYRGVVTSIPWLASTWRDQPIVNVPVTDIVPPIVDYNDGFGDFVPPREQSRTEESRAEKIANKDNETEILNRYNTGFAFTIRDAIKAQLGSKTDLPCSSGNEQTRFCETSSTGSTPSVHEEEASIDTKANPRIPERFFPSTAESVSSEFPAFITQSSITAEPEDSTLKTVMSRDALRIGDLEEQTEKNVTEMPRSIVPGVLKQIDKHNSPHEVSYTIKNKDYDLQPPDDFVSRLIVQHQRPILPTPAPNNNPTEFEIVKSLEAEHQAADISQLPDSSHTDNDNSSLFITINDTIDRSKQGESNVSMLSLLQLMAELLKLDRLPRPFSTKDLYNVKNSFNLDESVTENPSFGSANSKTSTFGISKAPTSLIQSRIKLLNSDPNLDNPLPVTVNPAFDQSYAGALFGDTKAPSFDVSKTSVNVARPKTPLYRNKASSTTDSSLLDYSLSRTSFGKVSNSKTPTHFDTSRVPLSIARSGTSSSLDFDKTSFVTVTPLLDYIQSRTPFADPEGLPFDVTSKAPSTFAFKASKEAVTFTRPNLHNASVEETNLARSQNNSAQPLQKEKILEQLTENFGQPLYRDDSIRKSLMFDLPQVQRSLEFKSGLPIEKDKHAIDESKRKSSTETATTESTAKTIVETEFVPSLGFSFDTNEGREEYVQAILGGLIDERTGKEPGENESSMARSTDGAARNTTQLENLKDV